MMATKTSSKTNSSVPETTIQQSILQQAEAVIAGRYNPPSSHEQDAFLQETNLVDGLEDNIPPPAYGDIYGEIHDEKGALGARITDDGRVNIRINQLNRRLSQIFTPALRQHIESSQDTSPPYPLTYIPPSLGGGKDALPPPPLNIVIQVVGSRGDVQPFIALGKILKTTYGHRVRLATHPHFKPFVQEHGLEFFNIGGDPSHLMAFMVKNPGLMPGFRSLFSGDVTHRRRDVAEYIQGCWRSCYQAGNGMDAGDSEEVEQEQEQAARPFVADCIIANPPSFAHIHCAEKLGIPLHIMFTMPYSPTQAFPHPLANIQSSNADPQLTNYISYAMIEVLVWQGLGDIINRFREKCLGLDPVSLIWAPGMLQRLKIPHTYFWSPALIDKPKDWGNHISVSGFSFLSSPANYTPAPDLQAFLNAGPPPIYIGFGSIVLDNPNAMTQLIFEVAKKIGQRVLLSKGWGGMGVTQLRIPHNIFMLGNVPHDWLFQHVSCVVHHGGAGTTAAGLAAGRPTVVIPFFGDQHFWGAMIARAGAGPDPIPCRQLTVDKLVDAINFCLKPESMERAKELANKIAEEQGGNMGAQSFHQHLDIDRLRCTLAPSRAAVWRIRHTQIRLSAFAACTLANANLINFHDLKPYRPREYYTDEGPWDPVSGFAAAVFGAISSMAMGVADLPSETVKPFLMPFGSGRRRSRGSMSTSTLGKRSETSLVGEGEGSTAPTSLEQSLLSSTAEEQLARAPSIQSFSGRSTPTSTVGSSSVSGSLQGHSDSKQDKTHRRRLRNQNSASSSKDLLGERSVHKTKGFGRIAKAALQSPMDMSIAITTGFHNAPKLWGDTTVRPPQQVRSLKTGAAAIGKEFAYGWYDGVSGLITQPWNGARVEGATGFLKGMGKGIGGFVTKPGAALFGISGYFMKGVHKEVQGWFEGDVKSYIAASRVAQGYEEWLGSSEEEREDVIVRWKMIQKYVKKGKKDAEEMMRDMLEVQRMTSMEDGRASQGAGNAASSVQSTDIDNTPLPIPELDNDAVHITSETLSGVRGINETCELPVNETSYRDAEQSIQVEHIPQEETPHLHHQQDDRTNQYQQDLLEALAASASSAQQPSLSHSTLSYEEQLNQAIAQSLLEQTQTVNNGNWESSIPRPSSDIEEIGEARVSLVGVQYPSEEKTIQEKTEEEILLEHVKKQSLLEWDYDQKRKGKGKNRATATADFTGTHNQQG